MQFGDQIVEHVQSVRTNALLRGLEVFFDEVAVARVLHRQHAHVELDHQRLAQLVAQVDVFRVAVEVEQYFGLEHVLSQKETWDGVAGLSFAGLDW